jgi:hypothetical protein
MLILILIAVWIAILAPVAVRRFRDRDTDRSIVSFHKRMAKLGDRGEPIVEPAHRLESPRPEMDYAVGPAYAAAPAPRGVPAPLLRVVPEGASQGDLDRQLSWDDWSRQYLDEEDYQMATRYADEPAAHLAAPPQMSHARAVAYSHVPTAPSLTARAPVSTARAQRVRRRQILIAIVGTAVVSTLLSIVSGLWLFELLAFASWIGLVVFLGLMYYAMSLGMIDGAARQRSSRLVGQRGAHAARVSHVPRHAHSASAYNEFDYAYEDHPTAEFARVSNDSYAEAL